VIAIDAMGCQKKIAKQIKQQGGDYVFSLKGNQGNLHDDVKTFFTSSLSPTVASISYDGEHGRIETRTIRATADIAWLQERHNGAAYKALSQSLPKEKLATRLPKKHAILSAALMRMIRSG